MALLGRSQAQFVGALARETGLDPRVVGAWALAEQSGGAARGYEQRGYHNFLNIARTDSGDASGAHSSVWSNPLTAARATAEWLKGQGRIAHEYGKPAAGIMRILRSGRSPMAQINAIATSGWASSGYNGGSDLRSLFGQLGGEKIPTPAGAAAAPGGQGMTATYTPGAQRLGVAQGSAGANPSIIAAITAALSSGRPESVAAAATPPRPAGLSMELAGGDRGIPGLAPAPAESSLSSKILPLLEQLGTGTESTVRSEGSEPGKLTLSGPEHALTNAVPHGTKLAGFLPGNASLTVKRIDQGQDIQTNANGPILAPGSGYVKLVQNNAGGFGTSYPIVHFTSGPLRGHDVYIGHTRSALPAGAHFGAGQTLSHTGNGTGPYVGNATGLPGWAEIGLWGPGGPGNMQAGRQIAPLLGLR